MDKKRRSRLLKGSASDSFSQLSQMAIRFLEVPLLLHFWGVGLYGEWLIIIALPAYLAISDFGYAHVAARQVTIHVAANDLELAKQTYQSASVLVGVISTVISIVFVGVIYALPIEAIFKLQSISKIDAVMIASLFGIKTIISMQTGILGSALEATGRYPFFFLLLSCISVLEFVAFAIFVSMGAAPIAAAAALLLSAALGFVAMYAAVRIMVRWFEIGVQYFEFETIRSLLKPSLAALAFPASQALNVQGVRIMIGAVMGPAFVALYVPLRQLSGFVTRTNIIGRSVNVELGLSFGAGDEAAFKTLALKSLQILTWAASVAALVIFIAAPVIFPFWTGGKLAFEPSLFMVLVVTAIVDVVWRIAFAPASATNRHVTLAKVVLPATGIGVILTGLLCLQFGLIGAAWAALITSLITAVFALRNAAGLINANTCEFLSAMTIPPVHLLYAGSSSGTSKS